MKRGDLIDVTVENTTVEGKSVGRIEGLVVFVRGGVPGDRVRAKITSTRKNYAEGDVVDVLKASDLRAVPRCRHFGVCGGCRWQHVQYPAQLIFKRQIVIEALERIGGFSGIHVEPTYGLSEPFYYRNKMEFSFGEQWQTREQLGEDRHSAEERFGLGLHVAGRYDKVVDVYECWLQSPLSVAVVNAVRSFCLSRELRPYDPRTHSGFLRNLVIREGRRTGDTMINLVTREDRPDIMTDLAGNLRELFPNITTIVNNVTAKISQVAVGEYERTYLGEGTITERIGHRTYRISANSFFQTNTEQAERLYDRAKACAELRPGDTVYDLYAGTGTIALHVADEVEHVFGIETVSSSVDDARRNADLNQVANCTFLQGDLKDTLAGSQGRRSSLPRADVVITDPPRAGMHEKVVTAVRSLRPRRIVYISCNPSTQARDLRILCAGGEYAINHVQPFDMFPHTSHIESLVSLQLSA